MAMLLTVITTLTQIRDRYEDLRSVWAKVSNILVVPKEIDKIDQQIGVLYHRINNLISQLLDPSASEWLSADEINVFHAYIESIDPLFNELSDFIGEWKQKLPRQAPGSSVDAKVLLSSVHWDFTAKEKARHMLSELERQISQADEVFDRTLKQCVKLARSRCFR
jgi:hypothetical protein